MKVATLLFANSERGFDLVCRKKMKSTKKPFAKKSFGQNFLADENYVRKIVAALELQADETIVEIGPGRGALTRYLLNEATKVFAVELDRDLIPVLQEEFKDAPNFHLIAADALKIDFREMLSGENQRVKLVANLPYYISTAILLKLLTLRDCFSELVLMLQREVVERIMAPAGDRERGFLTVLVETYCRVEKILDVPPRAFRPQPKVWSAVVKVKPKDGEVFKTQKAEEIFLKLVSGGFAQKRKTILNNLKNIEPSVGQLIEKAGGAEKLLINSGIEPRRRAETLEIDEWLKITGFLSV